MPINETPCPKCSKRLHLMAGVNVIEHFKRHTFLVCWKCKLIASVKPDRKWITIKEARKLAEATR